VTGELRLPSATGKVPAVILVHGSGGIGMNVDNWARELNGMGIATFILDGFTGRKIVETVSDQSRLGRLAMIIDAYRALELLSRHPRIDPSRIAIMGFSRGGTPALHGSFRRFQRMYLAPDVSFAAHIAFYASCNTKYVDDDAVDDRPIRLFHGTADTYVAIAPCRAYVARLKAAGADVQLTEYPDAGHSFDTPRSAPLTLTNAPTTRNCAFEELSGGQIVNSKSRRPFDWKDPCIETSPSVAYQEKAHQESVRAVREFLRATFKLP
jgi:dienelactone hydrolase